MSNPIYNELNVNTLKKIIDVVDNSDDKNTEAIIIKFSAEWCGPCKRIQPYCHDVFQKLPAKAICFEIDIEKEENIELYLSYKQKKMVRSVPTIFAYVSNPDRNKSHWWVPDFTVNSAQQHEIEDFFNKVKIFLK